LACARREVTSSGQAVTPAQHNLEEVIAMLLEAGEPHLTSEFVGLQTVRVA
jgi:hypothetical protein